MTYLNTNQERQHYLLWVLDITGPDIFFLLLLRNRAILAEVWISVYHLQNCWPLWEMVKSFDVTYCWANSISDTENIWVSICFHLSWFCDTFCSPLTAISQWRYPANIQNLHWNDQNDLFFTLSCPDTCGRRLFVRKLFMQCWSHLSPLWFNMSLILPLMVPL